MCKKNFQKVLVGIMMLMLVLAACQSKSAEETKTMLQRRSSSYGIHNSFWQASLKRNYEHYRRAIWKSC